MIVEKGYEIPTTVQEIQACLRSHETAESVWGWERFTPPGGEESWSVYLQTGVALERIPRVSVSILLAGLDAGLLGGVKS